MFNLERPGRDYADDGAGGGPRRRGDDPGRRATVSVNKGLADFCTARRRRRTGEPLCETSRGPQQGARRYPGSRRVRSSARPPLSRSSRSRSRRRTSRSSRRRTWRSRSPRARTRTTTASSTRRPATTRRRSRRSSTSRWRARPPRAAIRSVRGRSAAQCRLGVYSNEHTVPRSMEGGRPNVGLAAVAAAAAAVAVAAAAVAVAARADRTARAAVGATAAAAAAAAAGAAAAAAHAAAAAARAAAGRAAARTAAARRAGVATDALRGGPSGGAEPRRSNPPCGDALCGLRGRRRRSSIWRGAGASPGRGGARRATGGLRRPPSRPWSFRIRWFWSSLENPLPTTRSCTTHPWAARARTSAQRAAPATSAPPRAAARRAP